MANNLTSQNTANNFTLQNTANSKTQLAVDNVTKIESDNHKDDQEILNRWRLVLGKYAADQISFSGAQGKRGNRRTGSSVQGRIMRIVMREKKFDIWIWSRRLISYMEENMTRRRISVPINRVAAEMHS